MSQESVIPARSDSNAAWHSRASSPKDRSSPTIQTSIAPKTAAAMHRAVTAVRTRWSAVGSALPRPRRRSCAAMASAKSA